VSSPAPRAGTEGKRPAAGRRTELIAALGLLCLYLAVMSGHLSSIDGLVMWRQAIAFTHHSFSIEPPIWWGSYLTTSARGVGASLQYVPGILAFGWLVHAPAPLPGPQYDFGLLYGDRLYAMAGAPLWALITAATAYLVGLTVRALGFDKHASLWAMAFYGLGSPALAASRGDTPQPLVAACWALGIYACFRFNEKGSRRWLWICAGGVFYGVLARPLEGSMLLPAVVALLAWPWRRALGPPALQFGAWAGAVAVTLLTNWVRFASPLNFGYRSSDLAWTTPIWVGFPGALISPGRGVLWEFPALVLSVVGTRVLWLQHRRLEAAVLAGLPTVLFLEACQYFDWVGGWGWGFRLFLPALPLVATLAGMARAVLPRSARWWVPAMLLAGGLVWNAPAILTDVLGGYGATYADTGANFRLDAYPPIGAWRFLHHIRPMSPTDGSAIDIVWIRAARSVGWVAVVPFFALLAMATALWASALGRFGPARAA
jgi:hypothetical protein